VKTHATTAQAVQEKVRKQLHWYTHAGGSATYFGKVDEVPFVEANRLFAEHITSLSDDTASHKRGALSDGEMIDVSPQWIQSHRGDRTYSTR
jgi:hypothetical protein